MADFNATISQDAPFITQAASGSVPLTGMLTDVVNASEQISIVYSFEFTSEFFASSELNTIISYLFTDTINGTEELEYTVTNDLVDTVEASEEILSDLTISYTDTFFATDELDYYRSLELISTMEMSEEVSPSRRAELTDVVNATDALYLNYPDNKLVSTFEITDEIFVTAFVDHTETFNATDEILLSRTATSELTDSIEILSSEEMFSERLMSLEDSAVFSETFAFDGSVYNEILDDTVQLSDWLWAKDFGSIAWTLNTETGGLTNYDNFGFTSLAFHNGKLYGTSPDGLFELGADKDEGRQINAHEKTGFLGLGTQYKKRIADIYVGYTGSYLECDVETYDNRVYTYQMEHRDADVPHNSRIKPGRGLSSRYWRFTFRNVAGADFQIHDVAVQVAKSQRRL